MEEAKEMRQGTAVQTPFQVLQAVAGGLGRLAAFFAGNPAARMLHIVRGPAAAGTSPIALLQQLAALRAAGLLTADEFAEKKVWLLARI